MNRNRFSAVATISVPTLGIKGKRIGPKEKYVETIDPAPSTPAGEPLGEIQVEITQEMAERLNERLKLGWSVEVAKNEPTPPVALLGTTYPEELPTFFHPIGEALAPQESSKVSPLSPSFSPFDHDPFRRTVLARSKVTLDAPLALLATSHPLELPALENRSELPADRTQREIDTLVTEQVQNTLEAISEHQNQETPLHDSVAEIFPITDNSSNDEDSRPIRDATTPAPAPTLLLSSIHPQELPTLKNKIELPTDAPQREQDTLVAEQVQDSLEVVSASYEDARSEQEPLPDSVFEVTPIIENSSNDEGARPFRDATTPASTPLLSTTHPKELADLETENELSPAQEQPLHEAVTTQQTLQPAASQIEQLHTREVITVEKPENETKPQSPALSESPIAASIKDAQISPTSLGHLPSALPQQLPEAEKNRSTLATPEQKAKETPIAERVHALLKSMPAQAEERAMSSRPLEQLADTTPQDYPTHEESTPSEVPSLFRSRSFAALIDISVACSFFVLGLLFYPDPPRVLPFVFAALYLLTKDSLGILNGQSIGKKIMRLRAVNRSHRSLAGNYKVGLMRNLSWLFAPIEFAILYVREDETTKGKRLGDDWAQTEVIAEEKALPRKSKWLP